MANEYDYLTIKPFPQINDTLARSKGLSEDTIIAIQAVMNKIAIIQQRPLYYFECYKDAVLAVEALETTLQLLWGFSYNKNYQTYRFGFKDCSCPKIDNRDMVGSGQFIHDKGCVVHGWIFED